MGFYRCIVKIRGWSFSQADALHRVEHRGTVVISVKAATSDRTAPW